MPTRVKFSEPALKASAEPLAPLDPERLYSRDRARPYLGGIHNATMMRLEQAGLLVPIKLNPDAPTGKIHYRGSDLIELRKTSSPKP